jgi:thiamine pyrophosphokinase
LKKKDDFVIAADGGLLCLEKLNIKPDLVMGDFDSLGFIPTDGKVLTYSSNKNDTDMMLAVKKAIELGYKEIILFGGTGGRVDHTLSNIRTLLYASRRGVKIKMKDSKNDYIVLTDGSINIEGKGYFSLFAMKNTAKGVSISDAKYDLDNVQLPCDSSLCTSNEFIGKKVTISVKRGSVLIVLEK